MGLQDAATHGSVAASPGDAPSERRWPSSGAAWRSPPPVLTPQQHAVRQHPEQRHAHESPHGYGEQSHCTNFTPRHSVQGPNHNIHTCVGVTRSSRRAVAAFITPLLLPTARNWCAQSFGYRLNPDIKIMLHNHVAKNCSAIGSPCRTISPHQENLRKPLFCSPYTCRPACDKRQGVAPFIVPKRC